MIERTTSLTNTVGVIQMGGRLYDAEAGRFVQPDPFVQNPFDAQSLNRYSYLLNNLASMYDCAYNAYMQYEWDETKRAANLAKHGVDFADAIGALIDPSAQTREDPDATAEVRYLTLGRSFVGHVLLVVWTERDVDTIRLISARRASAGEARYYREN